MAPFLFMFLFLFAAASDQIEVTVDPGNDVILSCRAANSSISVVKWSRPDLKPDIVLLYRDGHLNTYDQHPSFKDRVELVDRDLKNGDVSLTLKNVSRHDAGTYECRVKTGDTDPIGTIRTIRLKFIDPAGSDSRRPEDGNSSHVGLIVGLAGVLVLVVAAAVVGFLMYKRRVIVVTVDPGDDATLPCRAADSSIRVVEWTRADLKPEYVLYYSDGHLDPTHQHPDFKDRVDLVDRDLKDGDVSLILRNVNIDDAGIYKCRVTTGCIKRPIIDSDPIRIIRLQTQQVPRMKDRLLG